MIKQHKSNENRTDERINVTKRQNNCKELGSESKLRASRYECCELGGKSGIAALGVSVQYAFVVLIIVGEAKNYKSIDFEYSCKRRQMDVKAVRDHTRRVAAGDRC